ncbi:T9SS C-terminal target domain-containing protein [Sphingobacteriales bacterium UPWRP_1]|nr:hypothetical protein BVG80_07965 [Sphingobacteriales bacterium TSM_CSM]PSJ78420.1 T9SS C-terminal target domain-containing protein [Sphingobacteriales bacterium UPWRP_1]
MKKVTTLAILLIACLLPYYVDAQPVLSNNYNPSPQPGTIINITRVNTGAITQGASGANITWNFESLSMVNAKTGTFVVPNATPFGASFPNSTIAIAYNPGIEYGSYTANYEFFNVSDAAFLKNGFVNNAATPIAVNYADPKVLLPYPFTYGNAHIDDFSATYTSGTVNVTENGSFTVNADAYGTLVLPYGTIHNVVRLHFIENYTQTIPGFDPFEYTVETYAWYHPKLAYPFFSISSEEVNGSPQPSIIARYIELAGFDDSVEPVGISEVHNPASVKVCPNPMQQSAAVTLDMAQAGNAEVSVYNAAGQLVSNVFTGYLQPGRHILNFAAADLPSGLYLLELTTNQSKQSVKLIIQ